MPSKSSQRSGQRLTDSKEKSRQQNLKKSPCMSSKHCKDHLPQGNSTKVSTASPPNSAFQQLPWSYDQTVATHNSAHSQYQAGSLPGLPSAKSWPDGATVPSQMALGYDLLGLTLDPLPGEYTKHAETATSSQSYECLYHPTTHQAEYAEKSPGYGLGGLDRFLVEPPFEQGTVYFGGGVLHRVCAGYCLGEL